MAVNLLDFISKDVQKYMTENDLEFIDFEKAVLIYNSDLTVNEKHVRLEALAESTIDETLKAQITERLRSDRENIEAFYNNTEGFIFQAQIYDPKYGLYPDTIGYFKTADLAYAHATKTSFEFKIEKQLTIGNDSRPFRHKGYFNPNLLTGKSEDELVTEHKDYCCGYLTYNKDGELTYFWSSEIDRGFKEMIRLEYDGTRFENAFIAVPNPFEKGDIVRYINGDESGVVFTSRKENTDYVERVKSGKLGCIVDFFDSGITVDFLQKNGRFVHSHINSAFLEKYDPQEGEEDYDLLMAASGVCKGECYLDWFTKCYDDYKEKHRKICLK